MLNQMRLRYGNNISPSIRAQVWGQFEKEFNAHMKEIQKNLRITSPAVAVAINAVTNTGGFGAIQASIKYKQGTQEIDIKNTATLASTKMTNLCLVNPEGSGAQGKAIEIKQIKYNNLNATVYTIDGIHFNTNPAALLSGQYLAINDKTSILKGTGSYHSLSDVEKMNTIQGNRIKRDIVYTTIGGACDWLPVVGTLAGANVAMISYLDKIVSEEIPRGWGPEDVRAIVGVVPFVGTISGAFGILEEVAYKPSFSPYEP